MNSPVWVTAGDSRPDAGAGRAAGAEPTGWQPLGSPAQERLLGKGTASVATVPLHTVPLGLAFFHVCLEPTKPRKHQACACKGSCSGHTGLCGNGAPVGHACAQGSRKTHSRTGHACARGSRTNMQRFLFFVTKPQSPCTYK